MGVPEDEWAPAPATPATGARVTQPGSGADGTVQVAGYADLVEVARGGDSIVYRAHQTTVGRDVAIKVISVDDEATLARFRRELEITVALGRQHPHIVNVLDVTESAAGQPCLVMDFHDLGSLHDRLVAHGPLPVSEVVDAGTAVADALTFAHQAGVLHRDVKPQNVLLLPTSYVLSDFGIARMADSGHTATLDRFSYRHASPQVLDGLEPTEADDVWSLGSTLFTLLDGRSPFAADDPADDTALAYLRRVRTGDRRVLARTELPAGLRELIEGCLHPQREDRIGTASEALAALRSLRTEDRSWDPAARELGGGEDQAVSADQDAAVTGTASAVVDTPAPAPSATLAPATPVEPSDASPADPSTSVPASSSPRASHAPVAPSALAHVVDPEAVADPEPDAEATGMMPDLRDGQEQDGVPGDADPAPPTTRGAASARPGRRILAFLSGAVLAGVAIGVGFQVIRQLTTPDEPAPPAPTEMTVPVDPGPVPVDDGPNQAPVGDQRFAPQGLVLVDRGTSAELSWEPPSQDVDYYLVVAVVDGSSPEVVQMVSASTTDYQVGGLDPDRATECYAIVGYVEEDGQVHTGSSDLECR